MIETLLIKLMWIKKVSLPSLIGPKPIITVWAEEKGPLGDGHYEFSFGKW